MERSLDPIAVLLREHRAIHQLLASTVEACEQVLRGGPMDRARFHGAIDFLLRYVDGAHSDKEHALFSALAPDGLAQAPASVRRLADGHALAHGSALTLRSLAVSLEGGVYSPRKIAEALLRYAAWFREHAQQEETELFPLARRLLPPQARDAVLHRFAEIAAELPPIDEAMAALSPGAAVTVR